MSSTCSRAFLLMLFVLLLQVSMVNVYVSAFSTPSYDVFNTPNSLGQQRVITIPVEFEDLKHQTAKNELGNRIYGDLNRYITEVSFNSTWIVGDMTDWVVLPHETTYYGRDFGPLMDMQIRTLFQDAIHAVDNQINFKLYTHILIVHAGMGQETTGTLADIWSAYIRCRTPVYADGLVMNNVIILPEKEARNIDPLGVYAHEFMHSLGLPDLYSENSRSLYMGPWDIMDTGLRNGQPGGSSPSHPSAWCKIALGWPIKTRTIPAGVKDEIIMDPQESAGGLVQALIVPNAPGRYYLIEVRTQSGFDSRLPSDGVLITDVNEKLPVGSGIVRVVNADPSATGLSNAAFKAGQSFKDPSRLVRIQIASENGVFKLLIDRTLDK